MTTNKISLISVLFVVLIAYLGTEISIKFNILDFAYLLFITISFIKFIYIRRFDKSIEE